MSRAVAIVLGLAAAVLALGPLGRASWQRSTGRRTPSLAGVALAMPRALKTSIPLLPPGGRDAATTSGPPPRDAPRLRHSGRDLHDGVQQDLLALATKLELARMELQRDPAAVDALLAELQRDARRANETVRDLAHNLSPAVVRDFGLVAAIEQRLNGLPLEVALDVSPSFRDAVLPQPVADAVYLVLCEALANALKHAEATRLLVRLALVNGWLEADVIDNGAGFRSDAVPEGKGSGLSSMRERASALGGSLSLQSTVGGGTAVVLRVPVHPAQSTPG